MWPDKLGDMPDAGIFQSLLGKDVLAKVAGIVVDQLGLTLRQSSAA